MQLIVENKTLTYDKPVTLEEVMHSLGIKAYVASVNNRIRELTYEVKRDAEIVFLDLSNRDATRVYESSLRYILLMAIKRLYPKAQVTFNYSISRSILAVINGKRMTTQVLAEIEAETRKIIEEDIQIRRNRVELDEAYELYSQLGYKDKAEILKYREEDYVNMYIAGDYRNYMFGYMVPSTGYIKDFKLVPYHPGFIIQYPRSDAAGDIPEFVDAPIFNKTIKEAVQWGKIIDGDTIPKINRYVEEHKEVEFINLCETKHNRQLAELGQEIENNIEDIRLICIAGPSSSGKTTFSNRVKVELLSRGMRPVMISIDDYYKSRGEAPLDENGNPDLEHIDALDTKLFNEQISQLINGEEVQLPSFNFKLGGRVPGKKVKIDENQVIIIEGIHALNDQLTPSISNNQKYKIFIAPQTQLHIDNHNPISFTDLRLLRRMVRDQKYRNSPAEETLSMWSSVRAGEFKWIYPFQEQANYVFNSELTYEFLVLKKHAYRSLQSIKRDSEHFITANRLLKFLKYFKEIDDHLVPNNSILREFIGGSVFH